jgi:hypothetical protein
MLQPPIPPTLSPTFSYCHLRKLLPAMSFLARLLPRNQRKEWERRASQSEGEGTLNFPFPLYFRSFACAQAKTLKGLEVNFCFHQDRQE